MQLSTVQEIMTHLNVGSKDWDLLLIGDGSGQSWDMGCGWACVLIDHFNAKRKLFYGGMNSGTIGIGELFPYVHAMMWYSRGPGKKRLEQLQAQFGTPQSIKVHVITDNEIVSKQGNGDAKRSTNIELWSSFDHFARLGYSFKFHWLGRDTIGLNALTDHISREARKSLERIHLPEGSSIYDYSPDDDRGESFQRK